MDERGCFAGLEQRRKQSQGKVLNACFRCAYQGLLAPSVDLEQFLSETQIVHTQAHFK